MIKCVQKFIKPIQSYQNILSITQLQPREGAGIFGDLSNFTIFIIMKMINITCEHCGNKFDKPVKYYERSVKKNTKHFCSRSCSCFYRNANMPDGYWQNCSTSKNFIGHTKLDELSPFRSFLRTNKFANTPKIVTIDTQYLKNIWESQNGICPYTNIKMYLPETTRDIHQKRLLNRASLDRIDSSIGYVTGNVEFVCFGINLCKNNFSKDEMLEFIKLIKLSP